MKPLTYLMLHCSATPEGRDVRPADIVAMHTNPQKWITKDGKKVNVGGRGWLRVGYCRFITLDGTNHILRNHDEDNWLQEAEITNGCEGFNSVTRHICYAGGCTADMKAAKDTRTPAQLTEMERYVKSMVSIHPTIKVLGHSQVANRACPSFDVPKWLRKIGIPEANIYS